MVDWGIGRRVREIVEEGSRDGLASGEKTGLCIVAGIETRENRRIERAMRLKIKIACVEKICYLSVRSVIR